MAIGLGLLRLSPAHFWSMSLPELDAALEGNAGLAFTTKPLSRGEFGALMARYPDKQET